MRYFKNRTRNNISTTEAQSHRGHREEYIYIYSFLCDSVTPWLNNGLFIFYCLCVVLSGCGYSTKSLILNDIKTIYIKTFANKIDITAETADKRRFVTYRPLLEVDLTRVAIDRFLFDGNLKIVSRENEADAVLSGELVDFRQDPLRYDSAGNVEEYRLNIVMNLRLMNQNKNELIWEEKNFTGDTTYFTSGSRAESEANALDRAITDLARRLVERTIERW